MTPDDPVMGDLPELERRAGIPVFVNSFEQLTYLRDSVDWFHRNGFRNVTVLEQGSVYAPLLDYFASADFQGKARLRALRSNIGPRRAVRRAASYAGMGHPFIFTDPDLDLPEPVDANFLTRLFELGRRHGVVKAGLALDIADGGRNNLAMKIGKGHTVGSYYARFYENRLEDGVWGCGVDTTFFLHLPDPQKPDFGILSSQPRIPAIRVGGPGFTAGHRPWYFDNGMPEDEEAHYRTRTTIASTLFGRAA
jgi:hypothetical protein